MKVNIVRDKKDEFSRFSTYMFSKRKAGASHISLIYSHGTG